MLSDEAEHLDGPRSGDPPHEKLLGEVSAVFRRWGRIARNMPRLAWLALIIPLLLLVGMGAYDLLTMPNQAAAQRAAAPYSTGTKGCEPSGAAGGTERPWFGGIGWARESAARYAAEFAPKKIRVEVEVSEPYPEAIVMWVEVCEG